MKKIICLPMILILLLSFTSLASADDISNSTHEKALRYLIQKNALQVDSKGNYEAGKTVTRAEFAHYLAKAMNLTATSSTKTFTDVDRSFTYYDSIMKASAAGIITGYDDGSFKPNASIKRIHMVLMIERALQYKQKSIDNPKQAVFADDAQIINDYKKAVNVGVELNIIQGTKVGAKTYFYPKKNATRGHAASFIFRMMEHIGDPATNIATYKVMEIKNKALVDTGRLAYTYDDIYKKVTNHNTQVITLNDKIIYMKSGLGYVTTNKYIALYSETINDPMAVAAKTEMQYSGSDGKTVRVNLAGHVGNVSINDVTLIPFATSKGRSYYQNVNGELYHYLVDASTGKVTASYSSGKAHPDMKPGATYYSWDGIYFSGNGQQINHYNYYQFLPIISKTQYTAAELDRYIMYALTERERLGGRYADASKKSKLIGLGTTLKNMEQQYGINAMMILSLAMHESDFGTSDHAQTYNNLFGLYVYDTDPLNKQFDSIEANIIEYIQAFLWAKYIPAKAPYANGAVFGTKRLGMNVKYASDPHWGAKAAGHYYRADKYLGFKDAQNPYTIGMMMSKGLAVQATASQSQQPLYTYTRRELPLIIKSSAINGWYEIVGEMPGLQSAYVSKQHVQVLQTTK